MLIGLNKNLQPHRPMVDGYIYLINKEIGFKNLWKT